jgi:hypothetical protein
MYWHVLGQLAVAGPLNSHYYLHSLEALAHAWADPSVEADLTARLAETVTRGA